MKKLTALTLSAAMVPALALGTVAFADQASESAQTDEQEIDDQGMERAEEPNDEPRAGDEYDDEQRAGEERDDEQRAGEERDEEQRADEERDEELRAGEERDEEQRADEERDEELRAGEERDEELRADEERDEELRAGEERDEELRADEQRDDELRAGEERDEEQLADEQRPGEQFMSRKPPGALFTDDVIGKTVKSRQSGEDVGEIEELVIGDDGRILGAVITTGGFLGLGGQEVSVGWDHMEHSLEDDDSVYYVDMDEETLQNAPELERD